jgi:hypothetical protein
MSNHYPTEKVGPRKSKVSVALAINHGLGGPKAMAKAEVDGLLVNIPARPCDHNHVTGERGFRALLVWHRWREVSGPCADGMFRSSGANEIEEPSEKSVLKRAQGLRTVNRHWWIGRVAQGERVSHG